MIYPRGPAKDLFTKLKIQCKKLDMKFLDEMPSPTEIDEQYNFVVDAIFGFSFKGNVRAPYDAILNTLKQVKIPICAVDVPSGKYHFLIS